VILTRSKKIIEKALLAKGPLTRRNLQEALAGANIRTDAERIGFYPAGCGAGRVARQRREEGEAAGLWIARGDRAGISTA